MWATMKALVDHHVTTRPQAIGLARRLSRWVMDEYAPLVEKFLGGKEP